MWIESKCKGCGECVRNCPNQAITATDKGLKLDAKKCKVCGQCIEVCSHNAREISGRDITIEEAVNIAKRDQIFYKKSGGGVTVSGGEACLQWEFTRDFFKGSADLGIHTALDTCGFVRTDILEEVLKFTTLVLYDFKLADKDLHRKYTGADVGLVLENAKHISRLKVPMWLRIPIIPGYTDSLENIRSLADIVKDLDAVERIDLLPYHRLGESKYKGLGIEYPLKEGLSSPSREKMEELLGIITDAVNPCITVTCK
jgi:pyruvate formate lyase activating enzyme